MAEHTNKLVAKDISVKESKTSAKANNMKKMSNDLLSREQQYMRLNEELEAKTASLVQEAELVMRQDYQPLTSSLLDNINQDDFINNWEDEGEGGERGDMTRITDNKPTRPLSGKRQQNMKRTKASTKVHSVADDVAMVEDTSALSLQKTISVIEKNFEQGMDPLDDTPDVLPSAASEMGTEAQIRFLKAKLRVMQEELDRLAFDCKKKDDQNTCMEKQLKEFEEERIRLNRTSSSQQTQLDKFKRLADDAKIKTETLQSQLAALRKELDSLKRNQKQQGVSQNATEVRLSRALEEADKYKQQLNRAKSSSKESCDQEKKKVEQLIAENKRLERQKSELMTGFKKQLKLIDILKRQKMHIEAAKMLSFTEDEFVKALEWGT